MSEYIQKNWRGLEPHPVDKWDHWTYRAREYEKMKDRWDELGLNEVSKEALEFFAEIVDRYAASEEAERAAGDSI